jgi:phosphoribosyl 1,2-cyclic phosphodiesterase
MPIDITSVGSSSSGNSYIIFAEGLTLVLDVGLTAKKILGALEHFGIDPEEVDAVMVTHEHVDHVRSIRAVSRKCCNAVVYASRGTAENTANFIHVPEDRFVPVSAGDCIELGPVKIGVFPLSHDAAEPVGFTVSAGDEKLAVVTDTGIITDEIRSAVCDADMLVFEANHDEDMLMFGEYPYPVKVRIKSDHGHLSNDYAGHELADMLRERRISGCRKPLRIMLAHLSFHNNAPLFARQTVEDILSAAGFRKGIDYTLEVAAREGLTFIDPLNVPEGRLIPAEKKEA